MSDYSIILICQHGASTGMLVEKMMDSAKARGLDIGIHAYAESQLDEVIDGADAVLLGPQVRFKLNALKEKYKNRGIPFLVIDTMDYGMLNGEKVLNVALKALEE